MTLDERSLDIDFEVVSELSSQLFPIQKPDEILEQVHNLYTFVLEPKMGQFKIHENEIWVLFYWGTTQAYKFVKASLVFVSLPYFYLKNCLGFTKNY